MKRLKNLKMQRPLVAFAFVFFAITCILIWTDLMNIRYTNEGSLDIVTGAFVEVFILTVFFEFINARQQKNFEKHLQAHLRKIEELIKSAPKS